MSIELKIKAKSLAAEATIIRAEEIKLKRKAKWARERQMTSAAYHEKQRLSLYEHRIDVVRWEARATQLARGYMKGLAYEDIERNARIDQSTKSKLMKRTHKLVSKYSKGPVQEDQIFSWFNA